MKYKLINKTTGEEHICEKVTIDGFDYYVSDEKRNINDFVLLDNIIKELPGYYIIQLLDETLLSSADALNCKKVIATNNPNIDIPKVVDEVDVLTNTMINLYLEKIKDLTKRFFWKAGFKCGYNKSQETHPNSDSDTAEFADWCETNYDDLKPYTTKELLQLWKEQKTKTLYYE